MKKLARALGAHLGEFSARYEGKYYGRHRALVTDVQDPKHLGRIRIKIPSIMGAVETGWCWPTSGGSNNSGAPSGFFMLPSPGDMVWAEFEQGDSRNPPLWSSGPWSSKAIPDHSRALPDLSDQGIKGIGTTIPASSFDPEGYGKVYGWQMPSGSRVEFDESDGQSRLFIHHHSGSHIEILSDGTFNLGSAAGMRVQVSGGSLREYVAQSAEKEIEGLYTRVVKGSVIDQSHGDRATLTEGSVTETASSKNTRIQGDHESTLVGSSLTSVGGNHRVTVGGQSVVYCQNDIQLQAGGLGSLVGQNSAANGGVPTQTAAELIGYNGHTHVTSRDATGIAGRADLDLDGTLLSGVLAVYASEIEQAGLHLSAPGLVVLNALGTVQLGGNTAISPVWKGIEASTLWSSLLVWLDTHIHPAPGGATSPVLPVAASTLALGSLVSSCPSTKVFTE